MKPLKYLVVVVLSALVLLPVLSACAPAPSPTPTPTPGLTPTPAKPVLPDVPITYPGDTDATIIRRAEWIEGAKKEGKVVWWGSATPPQGVALLAEFSKIYPFIKGDYWRGRADEIATKVEAEYIGGRYNVDICLGGGHENFPRWREMGMIEKFMDIIPGLENLDSRMYAKTGDWIMPGSVCIVPQYNTNLVSAAEAPKSWEDLLDPKWKGALGLGSTGVWPWMATGEGGWGIEKTEDFLIKLSQQDFLWSASNSGAHALLVAGEYKVLGTSFLQHFIAAQKKGAPVDWCRVSPVPVQGSAITMQKIAPHPNAARLFLEWLFSPQGLALFEELTAKGVAFPGSGTLQSKLLEGLDLAVVTEETTLKAIEAGFYDRVDVLLGITLE